MHASKPRRSPLLREQVSAQSTEPPYTDPYVRWCGRGGAARLPPIPINRGTFAGKAAAVPRGFSTVTRGNLVCKGGPISSHGTGSGCRTPNFVTVTTFHLLIGQ